MMITGRLRTMAPPLGGDGVEMLVVMQAYVVMSDADGIGGAAGDVDTREDGNDLGGYGVRDIRDITVVGGFA